MTGTLFDIGPMPPYQRHSDTSRQAASAFATRAPNVREMVLALLDRAGPVSSDGLSGGLTIQELAERVAQWRGRKTKETTICGRLAELREPDRLVCDSGKRRQGNAGTPVTVFVHRRHHNGESAWHRTQA